MVGLTRPRQQDLLSKMAGMTNPRPQALLLLLLTPVLNPLLTRSKAHLRTQASLLLGETHLEAVPPHLQMLAHLKMQAGILEEQMDFRWECLSGRSIKLGDVMVKIYILCYLPF